MRRVVFKPMAVSAMIQLCDYVESKNTPGAGNRFQEKLLNFIAFNAGISTISYPLCYHSKLARRNFSCLIFQDKWVIVFTFNDRTFVIHRIILGSKLK